MRTKRRSTSNFITNSACALAMAWWGSRGARGLAALALAVSLLASGAAEAADRWITHPAALKADEERAPITLQFRREFTLSKVPARALVRVSADNRYILYVNGKRVAAGPSRGDLRHWRAASLDLAPYLHAGANVVAAEVWNEGRHAPLAQVSARTGFVITAEDATLAQVNTGPQWRARVNSGRTIASGPEQLNRAVGPTYYVAGAPETHVGAVRSTEWLSPGPASGGWSAAVDAVEGWEPAPWRLVADRLPQMMYRAEPGGRIARAEGLVGGRFPEGPAVVPARSSAVILLDAGEVQAAYPRLTVSGGRGATVTVTYAEALYDRDKKRLADRAQVDGGSALGLTDTFKPAGGEGVRFEPFWWRVWRFAEVRVQTADEPLRLERLERFRTGYPFDQTGRFSSSDPVLDRIWNIGWSTVRLDAHETYMDSAYWEQLQYAGDTRLMSLITYAVSRDPRLPVQAIEAIDHSAVDGLPRSRAPANRDQIIPPFALLWVGMLHDHWMWRPETDVVQRALPGMRAALAWYAGFVEADGLVGTTPGWPFVDWKPGLTNFPGGPEKPADHRCVISLMHVGALQQAADLEGALGDAARARQNRAEAERLAGVIRTRCWSAERGLFSDGPGGQAFSQHANALAVLYDVAPRSEHRAILERITLRDRGIEAPAGVTGTSYYFAYYLARALEHAGLADRYVELLQTWRGLLKQNFTTWPETPDPSRSDSHAWSAHPTLDLLTVVAGVQPAEPGFKSVRIRPHLGALTSLTATTAHASGAIQTTYRRRGSELTVELKLPEGLHGEFEWSGQTRPLRSGLNRFTLSSSAPAVARGAANPQQATALSGD